MSDKFFCNCNVRCSLKAALQMPPFKAINQRQQRWSDGGEALTGENNNPRLRANGQTTQTMSSRLDYQ